jgi:phosphatidylglycerophosphatase A
MFRQSIEIFTTWFYVGRLGPMPGTLGTLAAMPLAYVLMLTHPFFHMGVILAMTLVAFSFVDYHERWFGQHDAQEVVVDEVIGFLVAMTWLPLTWQSFLAAFVLFRFLDIVKPFPLSWVDRYWHGSVGVVADDVLAGLITNFVLQVVAVQTAWLGVQVQ